MTARPEVVGTERVAPRSWSEALCCTGCRGPLREVRLAEDLTGRLKEGQLICDACDRVIAVVAQCKYDFHVEGVEPLVALADEPRVVDVSAERRIPGDSDELVCSDRWSVSAPHFRCTTGGTGDTATFTGQFSDAVVRFLHQPRGGIVDVFVDDHLTASVDLYTPEGSYVEPAVAATDLPVGRHTIVLAARGTANPDSAGTEVIVEELVLYGPERLDGFGPPSPLNFGNPYSPFIEGYVDQTGPLDLVLEVGGGDRRRCLANHVNFEYLKFELADVYGDIHALPFDDDTFAVVHSQAVFEHLANPQAAAQEIIRVTKPGGIIVTEVAFLQPLHAVPFHFYNMTLWGVQELFTSCELLASDWFTPLSETVMWLLAVANLTDRIPAEQLERIRSDFVSFDALMSHDDLKGVAGGVHIAVRKPS